MALRYRETAPFNPHRRVELRQHRPSRLADVDEPTARTETSEPWPTVDRHDK